MGIQALGYLPPPAPTLQPVVVRGQPVLLRIPALCATAVRYVHPAFPMAPQPLPAAGAALPAAGNQPAGAPLVAGVSVAGAEPGHRSGAGAPRAAQKPRCCLAGGGVGGPFPAARPGILSLADVRDPGAGGVQSAAFLAEHWRWWRWPPLGRASAGSTGSRCRRCWRSRSTCWRSRCARLAAGCATCSNRRCGGGGRRGGAGGPGGAMCWSRATPIPASFGSTFTSALLWYRLLPQPHLPIGCDAGDPVADRPAAGAGGGQPVAQPGGVARAARAGIGFDVPGAAGRAGWWSAPKLAAAATSTTWMPISCSWR